MADQTQLLERVSEHVRGILSRSPDWAVYHGLEHTLDTVDAAGEIAEASKLSKTETEIVLLAAWFHDTGYTVCCDGHEEHSARFAREFLAAEGYPDDRLEAVSRSILSTKVPQTPTNLLEQVICDADMVHLGRRRFFAKNDLIRLEIERREGKPMTDAEWLTLCANFVASHRFHTRYAREKYQDRKTKNLARLQQMLREAHVGEAKKAGGKAAKKNRPERGIETMFRVVPKNHIDLTAMADSKAHMIISTNSIIVSLVVGLLVGKLDANPHLIFPMILLFGVSLGAIIFAVLATRPKVTVGKFTKEDIEKKQANLLFFGNFHKMDLSDYEWGMKAMMGDSEYLYGNMIRDLHSLGQVLAVKYRYLRISFNIFMYGFIAAVIAFVIAVATAPTNLS